MTVSENVVIGQYWTTVKWLDARRRLEMDEVQSEQQTAKAKKAREAKAMVAALDVLASALEAAQKVAWASLEAEARMDAMEKDREDSK